MSRKIEYLVLSERNVGLVFPVDPEGTPDARAVQRNLQVLGDHRWDLVLVTKGLLILKREADEE